MSFASGRQLEFQGATGAHQSLSVPVIIHVPGTFARLCSPEASRPIVTNEQGVFGQSATEIPHLPDILRMHQLH
jgi:hypothetical protein